MSIPENASIPPKIGEYAYHDLEMTNKSGKLNVNSRSHWSILTEKCTQYKVACHYSLKSEATYRPGVTCHGIIKNIVKKV
jgi:hypothetical protein